MKPKWTASGSGRLAPSGFPAAWAGSVQQVAFRPGAPGAAPLIARLKAAGDGSREAAFTPRPGDAGPGTLEITTLGAASPALTLPLTLADAPPEVDAVEARLAEPAVVLQGRHLDGIRALEIAGRRFLPAAGKPEGMTRVFRAEDGNPLEGTVGKPLQAALATRQGRQPLPVTLLPARPRLDEVQFTPLEAKAAGLPIQSPVLIASTGDPCQVSLLAAKGYRFPSDPTFRVLIRNADDPSEIRTIPPAKIRIMGRNQKATFSLVPAELLGGRAEGKLEIQVQDEHAGPSDWTALPPTFLELPTISAIRAEDTGFRLTGQSLDQIEALAAAPDGPWEKAAVTIEGGREKAELVAPPPAPPATSSCSAGRTWPWR